MGYSMDRARSMGYLARIELTNNSLIASLSVVIYKAFYLDMTQGRMYGVLNETRTHLCRFASQAC